MKFTFAMYYRFPEEMFKLAAYSTKQMVFQFSSSIFLNVPYDFSFMVAQLFRSILSCSLTGDFKVGVTDVILAKIKSPLDLLISCFQLF